MLLWVHTGLYADGDNHFITRTLCGNFTVNKLTAGYQLFLRRAAIAGTQQVSR